MGGGACKILYVARTWGEGNAIPMTGTRMLRLEELRGLLCGRCHSQQQTGDVGPRRDVSEAPRRRSLMRTTCYPTTAANHPAAPGSHVRTPPTTQPGGRCHGSCGSRRETPGTAAPLRLGLRMLRSWRLSDPVSPIGRATETSGPCRATTPQDTTPPRPMQTAVRSSHRRLSPVWGTFDDMLNAARRWDLQRSRKLRTVSKG